MRCVFIKSDSLVGTLLFKEWVYFVCILCVSEEFWLNVPSQFSIKIIKSSTCTLTAKETRHHLNHRKHWNVSEDSNDVFLLLISILQTLFACILINVICMIWTFSLFSCSITGHTIYAFSWFCSFIFLLSVSVPVF